MADQDLKDVSTGQLVSEVKARLAKGILSRLESKFTPRDATIFVLTSILGIAADILFFPGGLSTPIVSLLCGVGGTAAYMLWEDTEWVLERRLKRIKRWRDQQLITDEQAKELVQDVIRGHISMSKIPLEPPSPSSKS